MIGLLLGVALAGPTLKNPSPAPADPFVDVLALHLRLDGQIVDQESLAARYDEVCAAGRKLACSWRAWDDRGRVRAAELSRLSDPVCAKGDWSACVAQAWALGLGDGSWNGPAPQSAAPKLAAACDQRVRRACTELGALAAVRPLDVPDPIALHGHACSLGEPIGCLRAADLAPSPEVAATFRARAGAAPVGEASCAEGFVAACEALVPEQTGSAQIATLERLCHRSPEAWCPRLAAALEASPSGPPAEAAPGGEPDTAWFGERSALLGWLGTTFRDHGLVRYADLRWAELRQPEDGVVDLLVLVGAEGEWPMPIADCAGITAASRALISGGVPVRAIDEGGGPARSQCLEAAGPTRPPYNGGRIMVDPRIPADVGPATARKEQLDAASEGLFACLQDGAGPEDPLVVQLTHRSGPPSKVKLADASRDPAFDSCALGWITATDLGVSDVSVKYVARIELW